MDAVEDPERKARLLKLEERVFNPRDILNADCLLVSRSGFQCFDSVFWFFSLLTLCMCFTRMLFSQWCMTVIIQTSGA